ncbi:MAG: cell surface protein, partial [Muribaculaceae bacterium]|nr:cell surface protein [Muribaculaceae bacterium]
YIIGVKIEFKFSGKIKVVCVSTSERENYQAGSSTVAMVYEYVPAPGQFINEDVPSMTPDEAAGWAAGRLFDGEIVSLGGFGGYITVGFGHSIRNFSIKGNAFVNKGGASNEPGIVYVMQDVNCNGLPDDEWYELRGSESGKETCIQDYSVTYRRPSAPKSAVEWTDCFGEQGTIDYMASFHKQDYYYLSWITAG